MNPMRLLRQNIDPAPLIAARKARIRAPTGHLIEHRYVLGHTNRIVRRKHLTKLPGVHSRGLHHDVQIEQHRIV